MENMEISLEGLNIYARHGVMEQERKVGNRFVVDISLTYPPALEAGRTDTLDSTINNAELAGIIKETMDTPSLLLENVAVRIRHAVMSRWPKVSAGKITVRKPAAPIGGFRTDGGPSVTLSW